MFFWPLSLVACVIALRQPLWESSRRWDVSSGAAAWRINTWKRQRALLRADLAAPSDSVIPTLNYPVWHSNTVSGNMWCVEVNTCVSTGHLQTWIIPVRRLEAGSSALGTTLVNKFKPSQLGWAWSVVVCNRAARWFILVFFVGPNLWFSLQRKLKKQTADWCGWL